ncbi:hypothetical protein C9374_010523 [Naegleria lovaniensis]|uniref:Uncharacterized protein n=1 Tax=Naegleria lovaniensis TaxID=51637 RepID=A0AA88KFU0_NAELO|nr:uncharacterized protein C9374_010523 [Naegleria lovaniensis]KAG2374779.1 hypothetical protein C9374_010523 [Naegleria lovaniensis]
MSDWQETLSEWTKTFPYMTSDTQERLLFKLKSANIPSRTILTHWPYTIGLILFVSVFMVSLFCFFLFMDISGMLKTSSYQVVLNNNDDMFNCTNPMVLSTCSLLPSSLMKRKLKRDEKAHEQQFEYFFQLYNLSLFLTHKSSKYDRNDYKKNPILVVSNFTWNDFCLSDDPEDAEECFKETCFDTRTSFLVRGKPSFTVYASITAINKYSDDSNYYNSDRSSMMMISNTDLGLQYAEEYDEKVNNALYWAISIGIILAMMVCAVVASLTFVAYQGKGKIVLGKYFKKKKSFNITNNRDDVSIEMHSDYGDDVNTATTAETAFWESLNSSSVRIEARADPLSNVPTKAFFRYSNNNSNHREVTIETLIKSDHIIRVHFSEMSLIDHDETLISYEHVCTRTMDTARRKFSQRMVYFLSIPLGIQILGTLISILISLFTPVSVVCGTIASSVFTFIYLMFLVVGMKCIGMHYMITNKKIIIIEEMSWRYNIYWIPLERIERVWSKIVVVTPPSDNNNGSSSGLLETSHFHNILVALSNNGNESESGGSLAGVLFEGVRSEQNYLETLSRNV